MRGLLDNPPARAVQPPGSPLAMPPEETSPLMNVVPLGESLRELEEEYAAVASRVKSILPEGFSVVHNYRNGADAERARRYTIRHHAGQILAERTDT